MLKSASHKQTLLTVLFHLISCGGFHAIAVQPASAQFKAWVMAKLPERPWGLGVDSKGNIYTSLLTGEVVVLKDDGTYDHIAWVPSKEESGKDLIGLVGVDKADNLYVFDKAHSKYEEEDLANPFHPACRDATATHTGIYKIDAKTRQVTALATKAEGWPFCFPHGVAVDSNGNVYMADVTYSAIWKISPDGKKVDLWSAHPLLNWPPSPYSGVFFGSEVYLGVSAITLDQQQKNIYAVTMGVPMVLRIPINEDGSAGEPQTLSSGHSLLDAIQLDPRGNIYVSELLRNEIWVLSPDGSQRILIANKMNAPLDTNTGIVLKGDVLCTSNSGFTHAKSEDADRTVVCMKGFPVPQETRPLVELSRPNAVGSCDTGFYRYGNWPIDEANEPIVAVNPIHPNNIVAAWTQGPFQDIIAAVSLDGGQSWQQVPIPLTVCSGGSFVFAGDPWISFTPNGELYVVAGAGHTLADAGIVVIKSGDGGLHWSAPLMVPGSLTPDPHASLTADPKDARYVYALWHNLFSRTTDGGLSWEQARAIVPRAPQSVVQFSQILVLPNGTLLDIYDLRKFPKQQPDKPLISLQVRRSTNQGQTWSAPGKAVRITPLLRANGISVVDPKTGQFVSDITNPSFAMDGRNGNLYAVWEDGRFSKFQYNDTAFAMSADGGLTWSVPIRVNRTPLEVPPANRQAFFPSIAVAADGTIGVSYYDFRFNDSNSGLPTDRWLVLCHPSSARPATSSANWGNEVRLTDNSFNMEAVVAKILNMKDRFFIGDYFGLATAGNDFVSVFIQPHHDNVTGVFFRRVKP